MIRFASITEAYCADALLAAAETLAQPSATVAMQAMWEESAIAATRTWNDQKSAYGNWLDVTVKWDVIDGMADARNAVAHGLGTLTRQQTRKESAVKSRLAKVGIIPVGLELVLSDPTLQGLAVKCRDFIFELDGQIQDRLTRP